LVNGDRLLFLFGILMLVVGAVMLRPRKAAAAGERKSDARTYAFTALVAFVVGITSGFFGVGGGFLIVPGLILATGMPMINAVGSSLLAVGSFGLATAVNYTVSGLVDWQLAAEFIAGGVIGGVSGSAFANRLAGSKTSLDRAFVAIIFIVAVFILYRSGRSLFS
jgi:uncharacterized membrane protein YfcA